MNSLCARFIAVALVVVVSGCGGEYITNTRGGMIYNRANGEVTVTVPGTDQVEGSGMVGREQRTVGAFDRLVVDQGIEATFDQGDSGEITVEADDNLLPLVQTDVVDGSLRVRLTGSLKTRTPMRVRGQAGELREATVVCSATLKAPRMSGSRVSIHVDSGGQATFDEIESDEAAISAASSGVVRALRLEGKRLEVNVNSAGRVEASGDVDQQKIHASSAGTYAGRELNSRTTEVVADSSGSAEVTATEEVSGRAESAGNIRYFGNPANADVKTGSAGSATKG